jgi:diacylglycerol kinase (ATP)
MTTPTPDHAESPYKGKTGIMRIWNAFNYSLDGLAAAYRHEAAFRQIVLINLAGIPTALLLPATGLEKALLIGSTLLCMIVELLNSAVEASVDHTSLAHHPLAKRAKDLGSAAQLMALINVFVVWALVLTDLFTRS